MKVLTRIVVIGLFVLSVGSAFAAPVGFSVNSDEDGGDELYRIDLATGSSTTVGLVQSASTIFGDVEGLAFDQNGVLWGLDDRSRGLFPISTGNGTVDRNDVRTVRGFDAIGSNDFGMTFTCSGELYITSVAEGSLFRVDLDGAATRIGSLGANISALAAYGNPATLYGLGNGLLDDTGTRDNRSLYQIDTASGTANLIGEIGSAASDYYEAGLAFDNDGSLWALTDRNGNGQTRPSEVLNLNLDTGVATLIATTGVTGFESLAIAPPAGCVNEPVFPAPKFETPLPTITTIDGHGKLITILLLMFGGLIALRSRP